MRREGSLAFPQPSGARADTADQPVPLLCVWNRCPRGPSFLQFPATSQLLSLWGVLAAQGTDTTRAPIPTPPPRQGAKRLQEPRPSPVVSWRTAAGLPRVLALVRAELAFDRTREEKERPFAAGYQARPRRAAVLPVGWGGLRPQGQIRPGAWGGSRGRGSARGVQPAPPPTPRLRRLGSNPGLFATAQFKWSLSELETHVEFRKTSRGQE